MAHYAVIGCGITGITTAWSLLKRGIDVTVFDRQRYAAMETSFANGGQLSASNAEVWTNLGTMLKGVKWMFSANAPLLFNPLPSWHKYSWMAEFAMQFRNYESNTIKTASLAIAAQAHLTAIAAEANISFSREDRGILHFYKDEAEFAHAHRVTGLLERGGLVRQRLTPDEVYKIEPTLRAPVLGGYFTPTDFTGDIHQFAVGLAAAAKSSGAHFMMESAVSKVSHDGTRPSVHWRKDGLNYEDSFDGVVVCAGVGSRAIAKGLGDRVNIYPVKGYSITVNLDDKASRNAAPWVSLLDDGSKIVTSRLGSGRFRVAGTAELNGENYDIRADRIVPLRRWVETNFPNISTEHVIPWAGLRPMLPSMMPRIGAGKKSGVFYNTGHGHLGWTLCCYSSEAIADIITKE